jgi:hypothetical protein
MAAIRAQLAKRECSAWSMLAMRDDGWRVESLGGWPNPKID